MKKTALELLRLLGAYAMASVGGYVFYRLGVPLPWMIGPLVVIGVLAFSGVYEVRIPVQTRPFGQAVVASQVGLSFVPAVFASVLALAPVLVGMALMTVVLGLAVGYLLSKMARISLTSAVIATLPTSPVEAAVAAERYTFEPAPIILTQVMRVAGVVILIPVGISLIEGAPDRSLSRFSTDFDLLGLVVLGGLAFVGAVVFRRIRISNPYFLGPLAFASAVTAMGFVLTPYPSLIFWGAQVIMGTWLGSNFRRSLFNSARRMVISGFVSTLLFIGLCATSGALIAPMVGLNWDLLVLGTAPGGVTEMAITAKFLAMDVALVTAFHLTRIFIVVPSLPFLIDILHRFENR